MTNAITAEIAIAQRESESIKTTVIPRYSGFIVARPAFFEPTPWRMRT